MLLLGRRGRCLFAGLLLIVVECFCLLLSLLFVACCLLLSVECSQLFVVRCLPFVFFDGVC